MSGDHSGRCEMKLDLIENAHTIHVSTHTSEFPGVIFRLREKRRERCEAETESRTFLNYESAYCFI